MILELKGYGLNCIAENKEQFYTESAFYHAVKKALQAKGFDIIKIGQRRIAKDGHLISNDYILTERKRLYCFYDNYYSIRNIAKEFNTNGAAILSLHLLNCDEIPAQLKEKLTEAI